MKPIASFEGDAYGAMCAINSAYEQLRQIAESTRKQTPDWESMARHALGATAHFRGDHDALDAIRRAFDNTLAEANRHGPIVRVHRPFFWADREGCHLEFVVDTVADRRECRLSCS